MDTNADSMNCRRAIEDALKIHPGVNDAAIVQHGSNTIAFVVPNDKYLDEALGRRDTETNVMNKWRKVYDLSQFNRSSAGAPVGFNTLSWDSSYTRQPIPSDQMREWVDTTVSSILSLGPKNIYEIGCGTGMLLTRIAPLCEKYVGVDFSHTVLESLGHQLKMLPDAAARTELMQRRADDFDGLQPNFFDTVILNSVIQYFPNLAYLTQVLENAINIVNPGGRIFVGDVRSLPLHSAFALSVELFQAPDDLTIEELRNRIGRRRERDPELVLSPAFFTSLQSRFEKISRVEIELRTGRSDNEMTRYRYNAVLRIGDEPGTATDIAFLDWTEAQFSIEEIRSMLQAHREVLGLQKIRNARIALDNVGLCDLETSDPSRTVGDFRRGLEQVRKLGIHPHDLTDLGASLKFQVKLSWAACRADGSYDAVFIPKEILERQRRFVPQWPGAEASAFIHLASAPGQKTVRTELKNRLMAVCRETLTPGCVPEKIVLVDRVPI